MERESEVKMKAGRGRMHSNRRRRARRCHAVQKYAADTGSGHTECWELVLIDECLRSRLGSWAEIPVNFRIYQTF